MQKIVCIVGIARLIIFQWLVADDGRSRDRRRIARIDRVGFIDFAWVLAVCRRCGRCFAVPLGLPTRLDGNHLGAVVVFTDEVDMNTDLAERWGRAPQFAAQGVRLLGPRLFLLAGSPIRARR